MAFWTNKSHRPTRTFLCATCFSKHSHSIKMCIFLYNDYLVDSYALALTHYVIRFTGRSASLWIGLYRGESSCLCSATLNSTDCQICRATFTWVDKAVMEYVGGWYGSEPDNSGNDCAIMTDNGWIDFLCTPTHEFLCKRKVSLSVSRNFVWSLAWYCYELPVNVVASLLMIILRSSIIVQFPGTLPCWSFALLYMTSTSASLVHSIPIRPS